MRVFLRNRQTHLYCAARNEWTVALAQALLFNSLPEAARFAFHHELSEAEIVVRYEVLDQEVTVPLLPEWCDLDQRRAAAR
jgi:hypothetical protein